MTGLEVGLLTAVSSVATVVGTVQSVNAQRAASNAQKEQQTLTTRRSRRQTIREAQIRRAQATASAQGAGSLAGSGGQGGIGSISSQLGGTLGYQSQYGALSNIITAKTQEAAFWGDVASIGGSLMSSTPAPSGSPKKTTAATGVRRQSAWVNPGAKSSGLAPKIEIGRPS